VLAPVGGEPANNFGFAHTDLQGFGCPLGSHMRRSNPRDSLPSRDGAATDLSASADLLASANGHRILRRGRKYGPDIADPRQDDGADRGLLFMCLNSDLVRHFEFIQQTWLLNPSFATLFDETDPLLGPPGRMTIPALPLRLRPAVQTFVQMSGGEYFFLPSLPALDFLGSLRPAA
jgi:deferrochelatase/peroxidase EfeB